MVADITELWRSGDSQRLRVGLRESSCFLWLWRTQFADQQSNIEQSTLSCELYQETNRVVVSVIQGLMYSLGAGVFSPRRYFHVTYTHMNCTDLHKTGTQRPKCQPIPFHSRELKRCRSTTRSTPHQKVEASPVASLNRLCEIR